MKEKKIEKISSKKEKEKNVRNQAKSCLSKRVVLTDPTTDLSKQLFEDAPTLYLNPTEKMHISNLVVPNSKFLTVLGSGDFAIDASFHGASEVLAFDINRNQYYPAALKVKGLQHMNYDEYWKFFSDVESSDYLSSELYNKLKRVSKNDNLLYAFFDEIIAQKEMDSHRLKQALRKYGIDMEMLNQIGSFLGMNSEMNEVELDMVLSRMNLGYSGSSVYRTISGLAGFKTKGTYLENEDSYKEAQEKIKKTKLSFTKTDLTRLKSNLEAAGKRDKFNSIYLSNVPEYIDGTLFADTVENQLMPLLEDDGVIAYCCQSTDLKNLDMSESELAKEKENAGLLISHSINPVSLYQKINSIEALNILKQKYNVDFYEEETASSINGLDDNDTYVYIKKR